MPGVATSASRLLPRALPSLMLGLCLAVAAAAAGQELPTAEGDIATAPVSLDGRELFRVRGVSSLPAAERARRIEEQIEAVAVDRSIPPESLRLVEGEFATRIQSGDRQIVLVVDADARLEQIGRGELVRVHLARIQQAIADYRRVRSPEALSWAAGRAVTATLAFALTAFLIVRLARRLDRRLVEQMGTRIRQLEIQSVEVMRAEQVWTAARRGLAGVRAVLLLTAALFYLGFVLAQIPPTRHLVTSIAGFVLAPIERIGTGIMTTVPDLILLAVLFVVFRLVLGMIKVFFSAVSDGQVRIENFRPEWAQPTYKIVRILVVAFGVIVAYPYMPGSHSAAFQGVSLFLGVMFSLGASSALANMIAGYMLIYRRAFGVRDWIKVGDTFGEVIEVRMQVTHLRTVKNEEVIIPNSQILTGEVVNYSSLATSHGLVLHTEVGIGYDTPWRQVEAMLVAAAHRTLELGGDSRPFVIEKRLGDFAVVYELNVHCSDASSLPARYAALHRNILDVFNEQGVQIMTPAYEGDPESPKVVAPKNWHVTPAMEAVLRTATGTARREERL